MRRRRITAGPLAVVTERARALARAATTPTAQWSLAQMCEHIALSIESTLVDQELTVGEDGSRGLVHRYGPARRWLFRRIILTAGYIPRGVRAPERVRPSEDASLDTELRHLEAAARAFDAAAPEAGRVWPAQRYTGPLSAGQWRRFHHVHAAHHLSLLAQGA
jgi:hypothetical protein